MALRVARGLFRLWLVASVLWIGGVGTMTWFSYLVPWSAAYETPSQSTGKFIEVTTPDGTIHQFPAGTASDVIDGAMRDYWRWRQTKTAAETALIPPVLLLVLGSALGWAFKGFRSGGP